MTFSERHGYTEVRTIAQVEAMDERLRMELWNTLYVRYFPDWDTFVTCGIELTHAVWARLLNADLANVPSDRGVAANRVKTVVLSSSWYTVYDLLELVVSTNKWYAPEDLTETLNTVLARHLAGYRFIQGHITPVTDSTEVAEVTAALELPDRFAAARSHVDTALALFSDRDSPDYANSMKESIAAVESIVRVVTGRSGFHGAVDTLEGSHGLHPKLVLGWKNLYGFTSDEAGVRHGGPKPPAVTQEMARYFLVTCSALVNLLASTST